MNYRLTLRARGDLEDIATFGERVWGHHRASRYVADLLHRMDMIAANPQIGTRRSFEGERIRAFPSGSHWIVYRTRGDRIEVVSVLHQASGPKRSIV